MTHLEFNFGRCVKQKCKFTVTTITIFTTTTPIPVQVAIWFSWEHLLRILLAPHSLPRHRHEEAVDYNC